MRVFTCFLFLVLNTLQVKAQNVLNNTNNKTVTPDTVKVITPPGKSAEPTLETEEIETKAGRVNEKRKRATTTSGWMDEPATTTSDTQIQANQNTYYFSNFQSNYLQTKNNPIQRSPSAPAQKQMNEAVGYFNQVMPGSFEANFLTYRAGNYDLRFLPELNKASELQPQNTDVQLEQGLAGIILNDMEQVDSISLKLVKEGYFSNGVMSYSRDLVQSIPENSSLLVHGTSELLPVVYERNTLKRNDLQVISLDLLQSEQYQQQLSGLGYQLPSSTIVDTAYTQSFCELNAHKNLFLSMSFPKAYLQPLSQDLVVYGLSFGYKPSGTDAYNWNLNLYKFVWNKEQLGQSQDQRSDALSANYLPCLVNLQKQFELYNRTSDREAITLLIQQIAARSQKMRQLKSITH